VLGGCSAVVQCQFDCGAGREMPSMAASHGGILYYVVKVPKEEERWVTPRSIERDTFISHSRCGWMGLTFSHE
jgi:hypothetical protein